MKTVLKLIEDNILVVSLFSLIVVFFLTAVSTSPDTYWFLNLGREIWQQKQVPHVNSFIYGPQDKTLNSPEWLSGLVYFAFFSLFGTNGLLITRVLIALLTVYFLFKTFKLFTNNLLILSVFTLFASYILATRTEDRPETFSYLFLSIINYSCLFYLFKQKVPSTLYLLPAIFFIWPNTHPFVIIGIGLFSFFAALTLKENISNKKDRKNLYQFLTIYFLSQIAALIQYKKVFIFLEASNLANKFIEFRSISSRIFYTEGTDFLNQIPVEIYAYFFFAILYLLLLAIFFKRHKKTIKDEAPRQIFYSLIIALPLKFYRLIPLTVILVSPNLLYLLKDSLAKTGKLLNYFAWISLVILIVLFLVSSLSRNVIGTRRSFQLIVVNTNKNDRIIGVVNHTWYKPFPEEAPEIISKYLKTQRLFTTTTWNNYLIWYLPNIKTFADAQSYNRHEKDWQDEQIIASGGKEWENLLNFYNIDTIVKDQAISSPQISTPVENLANWKLVFINETFAIYSRTDAIQSVPVDLSAIQPGLKTDLKYNKDDEDKAIGQLKTLLTFDNKNGFAREQLIIYNMTTRNNFEDARKLAEESRLLIPNDPVYSFDLAYIHAIENDCLGATAFQKETLAKSYNHPVYKHLTESISQKCPGKL